MALRIDHENERLIFVFLLTLTACAPQVTTKIIKSSVPLDYKEEGIVLGLADEIPSSAIEIVPIKIGDSDFSINCNWEAVIEKAKTETRKAGGNVVKIVEHKKPDALSSCHRITAKILKIENKQELQTIKQSKNVIVDSTWNYAVLYVFRPTGSGILVGYDLHLGDSILCRVKNNSAQKIELRKKG